MSPVDVVSVDVALEASAECADRAGTEAALAASLDGLHAPRRSSGPGGRWRLVMKVSADAPGTKSARAVLHDDAGEDVAERSLRDRTMASCVALARAIGAWAQVIVDDELARAALQYHPELATPPPEEPATFAAEGSGAGAGAGEAAQGSPKAPDRTIEVGTMMFLRNGAAATGGIFGASPFVTYGRASWVIRSALAIGTSTSWGTPDPAENLTYAGGRFDLCKRIPGNYIDRRGIELDACAGSDAAFVWSPLSSHVRWSVGPSAVVRGELGENFGLELRTMVGANLAREGNVPFFVVSGEVGGSVRFR